MKNRYISIVFLTLLITLGSCKKLTEGLDVNPNQPTDAPSNLVLNGVEVASILVYEGNLARIGGIFANSFTGSDRQYVEYENYNSVAADYDDTWDNLYSGVISQAKIGEAKATAVNNKLQMGIFQVIQAQAFGTAADLWGDVPFTEAADPEKFPNPKFDPQAQVYAGVQKLLDEATVNLSAFVGQTPGAKDIFYQGSASSWIAAANTLKARFYLHTKNYAAAITAAQIGIQSSAGNMMAPHGNTYLSDFNIYYSFTVYDRPAYLTATGAYNPSILTQSDPLYKGNAKTDETARLNYLYQEDIYVGGLELNSISTDFDGTAPDDSGFFGSDSKFPLVTFEENILILAEAYAKTGATVSALASLNIFRAYMNNGGYISSGYAANGLKYDPYTIADFLPIVGIANKTNLPSDQALLREILLERYVTFTGQLEQFNDVRRTKNFIGVTPKQGTKIPARFLYAQSEINTNPNTPSVVAGDLFKDTPINTTAY
jgi:hypothetical protein